jgi:MFS family permease
MFSILRNRRIALLAGGTAISAIGTWTALVAIWGYAAYRFDAGPAELALLNLVWGLPGVVLGPIAGLVIDRTDPRRVLIAADILAALVAFAMVGAGTYNTLLALALLQGVAKAFAFPAFDALAPRVVEPEELFTTNALLTTCQDLSIIVGPVLAAGVIAVAGTGAAFVVDGCSYLIGIAALAPLRLRALPARTNVVPSEPERASASGGETRAPRAHPIADVRAGLRITFGSPGAAVLLLLGFGLWLSFGTYMSLEPVYVRDVLHEPVTTFALLQTAFGVGLVGTGLLLPRWQERLASTGALARVLLVASGAAALYGGTTWVGAAFAGVFLWGITVALFGAPARTLLLRRTPVHAHGRVMATWRMTTSVGHLLPAAFVGVLAAQFGVRAVLVGAAVFVAMVAGAVWLRSPSDAPELEAEQPVAHDSGDLSIASA